MMTNVMRHERHKELQREADRKLAQLKEQLFREAKESAYKEADLFEDNLHLYARSMVNVDLNDVQNGQSSMPSFSF